MRGRVVLALATVYLSWSSAFLAIRFTVLEMPPLAAGAIRFIVAGLGFLLAARLRGPLALRPRPVANAAAVGALLAGISNGLVGLSLRQLPSSLAALIQAAMPLWIGLLEAVRPGGSRPSGRVFGGLVLGFGGTAILVGGGGGTSAAAPMATVLLLASSLVWSVGALFGRSVERPRDWMASAGLEMLAGGLLQALVSLANGDLGPLLAAPPGARAVWSLVYLVAISSWFGYGAFSWLLTHARPTLVATFGFVNPLLAVLLGWSLGGEALIERTLAAGAVILVSVVMVGLPRRGTPPAHPRQ
jgi:drug/metabolite transporter (DMT)-like permease